MTQQETPPVAADPPLGWEKPPRHVAIIMDGNGRWAQARNLPRIEGHRAGIESVRVVVTAARRLGVRHLTLYAFSSENWKRPKTEVVALMHLLKDFLGRETITMLENSIRLGTIGCVERLPMYVRYALERCMKATSRGREMDLILALSYGSRDELARAFTRLAHEWRKTGKIPKQVTPEDIAGRLDTAHLPDPDLLIRTSGELRISNFLLWQCAYSEFYFPEVAWPDFREPHLVEAIQAFQQRGRRFGGITNVAGVDGGI